MIGGANAADMRDSRASDANDVHSTRGGEGPDVRGHMPHNLTPTHTLAQLREAFLADVAAQVEAGDMEPETYASYSSSLRLHLEHLADLRIEEIGRPLVRQWYRDRSRVAPGAARSAHARLRAMLTWALDEGLLDENPAAKLRIKHQPAPGQPFTADELAEFCRRCEAEISRRSLRRNGAPQTDSRSLEWNTAVAESLLTCALTGSRQGVIRKAKVENYRPSKKDLFFTRHKTGRQTGRPLVIPLPARVVSIFERRITTHRGYLFLGREQTGPVTWAAVYRGFQRIGGELARGRHPHDLRHTMATLAVEAGKAETAIMRLGGWDSFGTFKRYSASATSPLARDVAEGLAQIGGS
jgi:integrase